MSSSVFNSFVSPCSNSFVSLSHNTVHKGCTVAQWQRGTAVQNTSSSSQGNWETVRCQMSQIIPSHPIPSYPMYPIPILSQHLWSCWDCGLRLCRSSISLHSGSLELDRFSGRGAVLNMAQVTYHCCRTSTVNIWKFNEIHVEFM